MLQNILRMICCLAVMFVSLLVPYRVSAQAVSTYPGALPDGAIYLIEVPPNWNGTLFLYSHGYVVPGSANPAQDVGDPATRFFMLSSGFAHAGSSYATTGWAIQKALPDQIAVLDIFAKTVGPPKVTIAWGHSLGGMITAGLIQRYPDRFDAALPMCGVLSGGAATWNTGLDETVRISADPEAREYLEHNIIYNGEIHIPVLTLHTTGDGLVAAQNESAYGQIVREEGNGEFLRRTFVARAGHCAFTPAETIAAVQTLVERLKTGKWPDVDAASLNGAATVLGPNFNIFATSQGAIVPVAPAFVDIKPSAYLRPFDAGAGECDSGRSCSERASHLYLY
jgi:pimeloyl-ACP methyl ester carboxylesterase